MRGDSGGDISQYWELRPQYLLIGPPRIPPQDSQVSLSTPGLFQAPDFYTELPFLILIQQRVEARDGQGSLAIRLEIQGSLALASLKGILGPGYPGYETGMKQARGGQ